MSGIDSYIQSQMCRQPFYELFLFCFLQSGRDKYYFVLSLNAKLIIIYLIVIRLKMPMRRLNLDNTENVIISFINMDNNSKPHL